MINAKALEQDCKPFLWFFRATSTLVPVNDKDKPFVVSAFGLTEERAKIFLRHEMSKWSLNGERLAR